MKRATYIFECFLGVADTFAVLSFWVGIATGQTWALWLGITIIFAKLALLPLALPVPDVTPVEAMFIRILGPTEPIRTVKLGDRFGALLLPYLFYFLAGMIWFYLQHGYLGMSWLAGLAVYTFVNCIMLLGVSCATIDAIDSEIKGRALKIDP